MKICGKLLIDTKYLLIDKKEALAVPRKALTDEQKKIIETRLDEFRKLHGTERRAYAESLLETPWIYAYFLGLYRRAVPKHVIVLEADMAEDEKRIIFHLADLVRKAGNRLTGIMRNRLIQLQRQKRYRWLRKEYGKAKDRADGTAMEEYGNLLNDMIDKAGLSKTECIKEMRQIASSFRIPGIFGVTKAEDIWSGIEKVLYSNGDDIHFTPYAELPTLRAKEASRGIVVSLSDDGHLRCSLKSRGRKIVFGMLPGDRFMEEELALIERNMAEELAAKVTAGIKGRYSAERRSSLASEREALLDRLCGTGTRGTFRPCYATLVSEMIRGKLRVFVHLTVEGKALPKYDRQGHPRHVWASDGRMGADINTQTVATYDGKKAGFYNLAERGPSIWAREAEERRILRAMDRSRRATNPQYFNEDGTIKKGRKHWKNSKNYKRLRRRLQALRRCNALNRHYAINEMVNRFREHACEFITEEKNAAALMKKARPEKDKKAAGSEGKKNRRRMRFGHSIQNRCPGYLQARAEQVFTATGGSYLEVPVRTHKATQFDPLTGEYVKHELWERILTIGKEGLEFRVLRDPKSAFGLYWTDGTGTKIDIAAAMADAENYIDADRRLQEDIRKNRRKIKNSGIRA